MQSSDTTRGGFGLISVTLRTGEGRERGDRAWLKDSMTLTSLNQREATSFQMTLCCLGAPGTLCSGPCHSAVGPGVGPGQKWAKVSHTCDLREPRGTDTPQKGS